MRRLHLGFTLIELVVAMAIAALVVSLALPSYLDNVRKNNRTDGKAALMRVMQQQERNYTANQTYVTDLTSIGFGDPMVSEEEYYQVTAASCGGGTNLTNCVLLTAAPQGSQVSDGNLTLNSRGVKTPADKW